MFAAFDEVLILLRMGKYTITLHAQQRMAQRNITHADIRNCGAYGFAKESEGKIKISGFDCEGEALSLICVNENGVLIITVF